MTSDPILLKAYFTDIKFVVIIKALVGIKYNSASYQFIDSALNSSYVPNSVIVLSPLNVLFCSWQDVKLSQ